MTTIVPSHWAATANASENMAGRRRVDDDQLGRGEGGQRLGQHPAETGAGIVDRRPGRQDAKVGLVGRPQGQWLRVVAHAEVADPG